MLNFACGSEWGFRNSDSEFKYILGVNLGHGLKKLGISCKTDTTGVTIGKKYARTDEIGVPFAITVDRETLVDNAVTLREIESTKQIRIGLDDVAITI